MLTKPQNGLRSWKRFKASKHCWTTWVLQEKWPREIQIGNFFWNMFLNFTLGVLPYLLNFVRNFTVGATQILMLIAEEVGTKSKWPVILSNGSRCPTIHILWTNFTLFELGGNKSSLFPVNFMIIWRPWYIFTFNIFLEETSHCKSYDFFQFITLFFEDQDVLEITHLIFVHFKGKENFDNWSQNILIERSEQVLNSRVCLKLFWPRN